MNHLWNEYKLLVKNYGFIGKQKTGKSTFERKGSGKPRLLRGFPMFSKSKSVIR